MNRLLFAIVLLSAGSVHAQPTAPASPEDIGVNADAIEVESSVDGETTAEVIVVESEAVGAGAGDTEVSGEVAARVSGTGGDALRGRWRPSQV